MERARHRHFSQQFDQTFRCDPPMSALHKHVPVLPQSLRPFGISLALPHERMLDPATVLYGLGCNLYVAWCHTGGLSLSLGSANGWWPLQQKLSTKLSAQKSKFFSDTAKSMWWSQGGYGSASIFGDATRVRRSTLIYLLLETLDTLRHFIKTAKFAADRLRSGKQAAQMKRLLREPYVCMYKVSILGVFEYFSITESLC